MTYSKKVIKNAIGRFLDDEISIEEISTELDVSKNVIYSWLNPENVDDDESLKKLSKKVREFTRAGRFYEAGEICQNFANNEVFQSQLVTILIRQRKFRDAKKICEKFKDYIPMQSQLITILLKQGRVEEAKEKCMSFKDDPSIQSQLITIFKKEDNIEEAKKICERFKDSPMIQLQHLTILIPEGRYEEAIGICGRFKDDELIQAQLPKILIKQNKNKFIGDFFSEEISQIRVRAEENWADESYLKDMETLDLVSKKQVGDLRARMQLLIYLRKYGLNDFIARQFKDENEIYEDVFRLVLFARDNPDINRGRLFNSNLVYGIRSRIIQNGGNEEYAKYLFNRAMRRGGEGPSL